VEIDKGRYGRISKVLASMPKNRYVLEGYLQRWYNEWEQIIVVLKREGHS
jgi:hypothetical protein